MRQLHVIALATAALVLACGEHSSQSITEQNRLESNRFTDSTRVATLTVTVLSLTRDSSFKPVANARVRFVRVGDVPPDSIPDSLPPPPPDSTPPDSTPPSDSLTALGGPIYLLSDSIPGDSTPPPPPPPPSTTCGREGRTVARGLTNRQGMVTATGLRSGEYDIVVEAPAGSRLQDGAFCGVDMLPGQSNQVQVVLVPAAG